MLVELGHFALTLAVFVLLFQAGAGLAPPRWRGVTLARRSAVGVFWLMTLAVAALVQAYALSDFSVLNVAANSNTMKPFAYKLTGFWGNHEGSMLLWLWMMSAWTAAYAVFSRAGRAGAFPAALLLGVQGAVAAPLGFFVLLTSNPFLRLDPAPVEGLDLNPVLQDPLLIAHPPLLYLGVTGFGLIFSWAVAALLSGRATPAAAAEIRPWSLAAWGFLTAGIALGSFWAYYELGWGGFWFWDPVENISLLPWIAGAALLHALAALARRGAMPGWSMLLAMLPFLLALFGTFLVRSGLLTSVHAFAADPARGVALFAVTAATALVAFAVFAWRAPRLDDGTAFGWLSRDSAILANNVFMCAALTTVFIGTAYPLLLAALSAPAVSVGPPYYLAVLTPLLLPFAFVMGVAPLLAWRRTPAAMLRRRLRLPLLLSAAGCAALWIAAPVMTALAWVGMAAALWIVASTLADLFYKSEGWRRPGLLSRGQVAMAVAHAGFAVMLAGATAATQWGHEDTLWMKPGDRHQIGRWTVSFLAVETGLGRNYNLERGVFSLRRVGAGGDGRIVAPEKRWYPVQAQETSESALALAGFGMFSIVLGEQDEKDPARRVVRFYDHPLVSWVFLGGGLMAMGAGLAASGRPGRREARE